MDAGNSKLYASMPTAELLTYLPASHSEMVLYKPLLLLLNLTIKPKVGSPEDQQAAEQRFQRLISNGDDDLSVERVFAKLQQQVKANATCEYIASLNLPPLVENAVFHDQAEQARAHRRAVCPVPVDAECVGYLGEGRPR